MPLASAISRRPRWSLLLLAASALGVTPVGTAQAQSASRITAKEVQQIQDEALALLAIPRVAAASTKAQSAYIEKHILYAFAREAGLSQAADLTPAERDQAQRLVGAVLSGAAASTTYEDEYVEPSVSRPATTRVVTAPTYVYLAPPPPPPIVFVPAPAPLYYLTPAPTYFVMPYRHHGRGW